MLDVPVKILVAGDGRSAIHEVAVAKAFRELGHRVEEFHWGAYFDGDMPASTWLRAQNKLLLGPRVRKVNEDFTAKVLAFEPEIVFVYRGTHITPGALETIKQRLPSCRVLGYNNDDPFGPGHSSWMWRNFIRALPIYDVVFAYRPHNIQDFTNAGAKRVELLMPWYLPQDAPVRENVSVSCDVVFAGHYENDDRLVYLEALCEQKIDLKLYGPGWDRAPKLPWLSKFRPIDAVRGPAYYDVLRSSRIALCFLSKLNRDRYTRRSFEIPFAGTFMLSEYSDELAAIFRPGVEADYFRGPEEIVAKVRMYLAEPSLRVSIARAGLRRVVEGRHDVVSRMRDMLTRAGAVSVS